MMRLRSNDLLFSGALLLGVTFACNGQDNGTMLEVNGTSLYIETVGTGENLLFVHGGPGLNHAYFQPHVDPLSNDFKLVFFDQRMCGRSAIADSVSIAMMVEDMEAVRKELGLTKLNLVGHSWGAVLVTRYALAYPENVARIIYSNPVPFNQEYDAAIAEESQKRTTQALRNARARLRDNAATVADYDRVFKLTFQQSAYDTTKMEMLNLDLPENFVEANGALFGSLMKDSTMRANLYDSLANIDVPVLIIHGASDLIPASAIQRLQHAIKGAQTLTIPRCGHFSFVEQPLIWQTAVREFLKR